MKNRWRTTMAVGLGVAVLGACGGGGKSTLSSSTTETTATTSATSSTASAPSGTTAASAATTAASGSTTTATGATSTTAASATGGAAAAPCTLLTAAQVQDALGTGLRSAPRDDADAPSGSKGCEWPTVDVEQQFTVDVYGDDRYMPATDDPKNIAVSGIGQAAVYESDWHRIQVKTAKGVRFQVKFVIGDVAGEQGKITKLATDVAAHL